MPIQAFPVNCDGGLVLDKSVFVAKPGEAVTLQNYEPSVTGGYSKILGFTKFDENQMSGSGGILGVAIFQDKVVAARGANVATSSGSGCTPLQYTTGQALKRLRWQMESTTQLSLTAVHTQR